MPDTAPKPVSEPVSEPISAPPSLQALVACFFAIGMQSFGGGLSSWIRREIVQKRGWLADRPFLSGLALSQIAPGPNAVNLTIFIGTSLRGIPGAIGALFGLLLLPVVLILAIGQLYFTGRHLPAIETALGGLGYAAIGLNFANGIRLSKTNISRLHQVGVIATVTIAIGIFRLPLLAVLAVMIPASLLLEYSLPE